ncbi:PqqD family protein [Erythrobacter mangrovi]|uniref:PqqD family protein n=1 Tax=Erythrobacter mangrovi TaxID=2739433 RepID=A0A7D4CCK4_9SPHN|nr:PqqD family protein [Erythrobacter mangrovi]QKG70829.1 PqqD family protein [Erythrobacter mangrovi]
MSAVRKLAGNFVETDVDDEVLIVDLEGGELFSLRGTARDTWRLIDGQRSLDEIVASLAGEYDAPEDRIAGDTAALINELVDAALVSLA